MGVKFSTLKEEARTVDARASSTLSQTREEMVTARETITTA
jgi:hypothetical protein